MPLAFREAENLLMDKPLGCFLVRISQSRPGYTLTYRYGAYPGPAARTRLGMALTQIPPWAECHAWRPWSWVLWTLLVGALVGLGTAGSVGVRWHVQHSRQGGGWCCLGRKQMLHLGLPGAWLEDGQEVST